MWVHGILLGLVQNRTCACDNCSRITPCASQLSRGNLEIIRMKSVHSRFRMQKAPDERSSGWIRVLSRARNQSPELLCQPPSFLRWSFPSGYCLSRTHAEHIYSNILSDVNSAWRQVQLPYSTKPYIPCASGWMMVQCKNAFTIYILLSALYDAIHTQQK